MLNVIVIDRKHRPNLSDTFQRENPQAETRFEFVDSAHNSQLPFPELIRAGIVTETGSFSLEEVSFALSHKTLWERCVSEGGPLVVCEGHVLLRNDFSAVLTHLLPRLPVDWDFVLLTYNLDTIVDVQLFPGVDQHSLFSTSTLNEEALAGFRESETAPNVLRLNNAFGIVAYAISPRGAKQLLARCFPMSGISVNVPALRRVLSPASSLVVIMNAHYRSLNAYCVAPPLAISAKHVAARQTFPIF